MQSVVSDRGSFTIEASLVCTFIVIIVMNLVILLLQIFDLCIIHEDINRRIIEIDDAYQRCEKVIINKKNFSEKNVIDAIDKIEHRKNYGVRELFCTEIYKIDYYYNGENLEVDINYGYKGYARSILSRLINVDNNYNFHRKFKLISICDNVRVESNVQP